MGPIVYLHEEQLESLELHSPSPGLAFSWDDVTVIHAHAGRPAARPAGIPLPCVFVRISAAAQASDSDLVCRKLLESGRDPRSPGLAIAVTASEGGFAARAWLRRDGVVTECEARFVPPRSELFSRARGLLETDAISARKVAVVGVGSGGSTIAVELAKAGVGSFVLVDPDRLELSNVARHVCGVSDLGRYKTRAVRDALLDKNPHACVTTWEADVNEDPDETARILEGADLVVGATDQQSSRYTLNRISLASGVTALFGRALTRAAGGDVLRVRPGAGPCLACVFANGVLRAGDEEVSTVRQAGRDAPAYVSPGDLQAIVQPGLAADIAPISNMIVRLALLELSRGTRSAFAGLDEDLSADLYIWANRRDGKYAGFKPMACGSREPSILRWYGAKAERKASCPECGGMDAGPEIEFCIG